VKIQFINAPYLGRFSRAQRSPGVIKSGTMYYPYWLAHAAAVAEKRGHDIHLIDCPASGKSLDDLKAHISDFKPDVMVIESVTASWYSDCRVAAELKRVLPNAHIVMCGTHVTAMWRETLIREAAVDFIAIGEYDYTISEIAENLQAGGDNIVNEMLWVQKNMPEIKEITFEDDNFAADRKFAREFADLVREKGVRLPFFANLRTTVDFETLHSLKAAGLRNTAVGFESGDNMILRNMRKGQNNDIQKRFVENAHKLGLLVHGCFMVGFPGETRETMNKTLKLAKSIKPDSAQFYPVMPYPGTGAYAYYKQEGYLAHEEFDKWLTEDGGHRCVLNLPDLPPNEIEAFCERAFRQFHFNIGYLFYKLRQALFSPKEGWRSFVAGLQFVKYTVTNKRKKLECFDVEKKILPPHWREHIKVPMGRMERLKRGV